MKRFVLFLNACLMATGIVFLLVANSIYIDDTKYQGYRWLFGYKETKEVPLLGKVTYEYFKGGSFIGILLVAVAASIVLLSLLVLFLAKKNNKVINLALTLTLVLATVCASFVLLITNNTEIFANYGSTIQASLLLGEEAKVGFGAYIYFFLTLGTIFTSFCAVQAK